MEYHKIIAVTGLPGLFELINSKNDGAIIRSLEDRSTRFASSRIHNFSHLESIEVYTTRDNVNLVEIFHAMDRAGGSLPDYRDNGAVRSYFEKVYPELDFERVYSSDLKKMIRWYDVLKKNGVEIKLSEVPAEAGDAGDSGDPGNDREAAKAAAEPPAPAEKPRKARKAADTAVKEEPAGDNAEAKAPKKKKAAAAPKEKEGEPAPAKAARTPRKKSS
ncbi:MAG TPA: DUF5606 domain-containing protein [Chitinophagaceae bacterium]|nr:DUF5606 domain-containing protein [Chitinophagaceae bacterium]